jgi:hypothetical protein
MLLSLHGPLGSWLRIERPASIRFAMAVASWISTQRNAPRILVPDRGRMVSPGAHAELRRDCTICRWMWNAPTRQTAPNRRGLVALGDDGARR